MMYSKNMNENTAEQQSIKCEVKVPKWFEEYADKFSRSGKQLKTEVFDMSKMTADELNKHLGGDFKELPYEALGTILSEGSDDLNVAKSLREMRETYLADHPEKQISKGASEGVITFDGRFISQKDWETATDSEKRAIMVGSTCIHFNSDTPGMGSSPKDRF